MDAKVTIIRSRRRTVAIQVSRSGVITVRAPKLAPLFWIREVLAKKQSWIQKQQQTFVRTSGVRTFSAGERFLFFGTEYPLQFVDEYFRTVRFEQGTFYMSRHQQPFARSVFIRWYAEQAKQLLPQRLQYYSELVPAPYPQSIAITSARTRLGSCSARGTINFSWRLVLAPELVIDYVVVHELAHLVHHNHGKEFWALVKKMYPNTLTAKQWLRQNTYLLDI